MGWGEGGGREEKNLREKNVGGPSQDLNLHLLLLKGPPRPRARPPPPLPPPEQKQTDKETDRQTDREKL